MGDANDYSRLRGPVKQTEGHDYAAGMRYAMNERNWFKRARGEWPESAEGMTTTITVVNGADGLTPDMLRVRKPENVECQTCGGVDARYLTFQTSEPCPDCTPENVETPSPSTCVRCGRLPSINGNDETVMMVEGGFQHAICDDRWDTPENVEPL